MNDVSKYDPQNEMYQAIIDNSQEFIVAIDLDYRFICFNKSYQQEVKKLYHKDVAIGMSLHELLSDFPEDEKRAIDIFDKAFQGEFETLELELGTESKQHTHNEYKLNFSPLYNNQGKIIGAIEISSNIGTRKIAEVNSHRLNETLVQRVKEQTQQLVEQVQLTKTITDNTTSALFMMDAKGHPTFMNPAAERITGYKLEEIRYRPLHYAIHYKYPDGRHYPMEECPLDNSSAELRPMQNQEEVFVDKAGRLFPVVWSVAPLEQGGQKLGAVIEFRDVTMEKKAEEGRLAALELAKEQERQRAQQAVEYRHKQEEFIDTICHEIRNPLNGVYGVATLIEDNLSTLDSLFRSEGEKLDPCLAEKVYQTLRETKQNLGIIRQCAQQQKSIVDDVLDLSKLEQNKIELNSLLFNIKEQVELVVKMFAPQIYEKRLEMSVDVEDKWVNTDVHRFTQIMSNLISNAVKFTHEGSVNIQVAIKQLKGASVELHISVSDTGIGIEPDEISKLFDRFTQANRRTVSEYGGSGLGLAITKKLVEAMGGSIQVKSRKWGGTCFELTIQALAPTLEEQEQVDERSNRIKSVDATKISSRVMSGSKRILVVEDNPVNQKVLVSLLNKKGHLCEIAKNGAEAVEKYTQFSFDCILMDIEMPVMSGLESTRQIRLKELKSERHTPIIGLSGNARKEQIQIALDAGMDAYLTKPYHAQDVHQKIEECCLPSLDQQRPRKKLRSLEEN